MLCRWFVPGLLVALLSITAGLLPAQTALSVPGCEAASPAVRQILKDKLESPEFQKLPYDERNAITQKVATELIAKYPREVDPYLHLIAVLRNQEVFHPEQLARLQEELEQKVKEHPDDPLMLYVAATALRDRNTARSIEFNNRAIALAPNFPWPYADLTGIYGRGKTLDKDKEQENLKKYWALCPTSSDGGMRFQLMKDIELQARVAPAERAYLATATDPEILKSYTFLWGLEFRAASPMDYPALRKKVAADVARLERANPKPDAAWAAFLIEGYKQSGAPLEAITAKEDALLKAWPHSAAAMGVLMSRWRDAHPEPENQGDVAAWKQWRTVYRAAVEKWLQDFPDQHQYLVQAAFFATEGDDSLTEADGVARMNAYVKTVTEQWGPEAYVYVNAADFLLNHHWQPARALEMLKRAQQLDATHEALDKINDNRTQKQIDDAATFLMYGKSTLYGDLLLAATRTNQPDAVDSIKVYIEAPAPSETKYLSSYWQNRARLAVLEGRKADGLAYYRLALETRLEPPKMRAGILRDPLGDEARALWAAMGGSESAWAAWSPHASTLTANADAARWEKPTQPLTDFSLTDLSGKTWKLADLHGKVVLINVWATWCGPCQAELPQLQKLYEQVKGRNDLQILTFDIDEEPGQVDRFLKKKGYTFPVLPAFTYTVNLLNGIAIPQNWIVNEKGTWQWTQIGYGSDDAWQKDMLAKMESVKGGA